MAAVQFALSSHLRLFVSPSDHLLQPRPCPRSNVSLGGGDGEADGLGDGLEIFGLKLVGEIVPEGLEEEGLFGFANYQPRGRGRELVDDTEHVLLEDFADG